MEALIISAGDICCVGTTPPPSAGGYFKLCNSSTNDFPPDEMKLFLQNIVEAEAAGTLLVPQDAEVILDIIDLQGRKVIGNQLSVSKGSNLLKVDLKNVQSGVYFIRISPLSSGRGVGGEAVQGKFVKL